MIFLVCHSPCCTFAVEIMDPSGLLWCLWDAELSAHASNEPGWLCLGDL